jgi:C-terminal processing protease CtpA/Prc
MAQLQYYSEATGQFEARGTPERVLPAERQFRFPNLALLVDQSCYSACELEAYALSQVPDILVVGQYPTAGVEADVLRGQFELPENISLQIPTGRLVLDGEIFLEGKGVEPTVRIPIDENTVSLEEDVVLQRAEEELQNR